MQDADATLHVSTVSIRWRQAWQLMATEDIMNRYEQLQLRLCRFKRKGLVHQGTDALASPSMKMHQGISHMKCLSSAKLASCHLGGMDDIYQDVSSLYKERSSKLQFHWAMVATITTVTWLNESTLLSKHPELPNMIILRANLFKLLQADDQNDRLWPPLALKKTFTRH